MEIWSQHVAGLPPPPELSIPRQRGREAEAEPGEAGALRGRRGGASSSPAPPEAQRRYMSLHQHLTWKAMPNIIGT